MSREDYMEYMELYSRKINERQDAMQEVSREKSSLLHDDTESEWITAFKKHSNIVELTRPVLVELKKVETYADRNSVRDSRREWLWLLDDVECRKVDTVLIASIRYASESFSTVSVDVGRFFYPAGIRFIAIEDEFDSMKDDMQEYLERCASMQSSYIGRKWMEDGFKNQKIYKAAVPYGYRYVADGNPQIIIDPETAPYVVKLFEMAIRKASVGDGGR